MQQFETDIVTRGKLIQIKGNISPESFSLARLLANYKQTVHPRLSEINEKINYTGNELVITFTFSLLIIASELYNLFQFSNSIVYECSIITTIIYTLLFSSLLNFKKQILLQLIALGVSLTLLFLAMFANIYDLYAAASVVFCFATSLVTKIAVYGMQSFYAAQVTVTFTFESNLLLAQFLIWKVYQCLLTYWNILSFNYCSLTSTIIVLATINIIKSYQLFDYEVIHLINLFKEQHQKIHEDKEKSPLRMTNSVAVFIPSAAKDIEDEGEDKNSKELQPLDEVIIEDENMGKNESIGKIFNSNSQETDQNITLPQSKKRLLTLLIACLVSVGYIGYIVYKYLTVSQTVYQSHVLWYFSSFVRMSFLLMICQYEKNIQIQVRDGLNFTCIFIVDCFLMIFAGFGMQMPNFINISAEQAIINVVSPLITIKIFSHLNKSAHMKINNGQYSYMFFFFLLPIQLRQIFIVEGIQVVSYSLDGVAIIYSIFDIFWVCRDDIFAFTRQIRNMLSSKKNRLKIFERIKLAKFDYESILQNFLYFHIIYISTTYYFMSSLTQLLEISYYIIYFSPIIFYLSALVNSYKYNQNMPENYFPSLQNILLIALSLAYIVITQIGIVDASHQTWSVAVVLNIGLFVLTLEGQKLGVVYLKNYFSFIRILIITYMFVLIYIPFIIGFSSGYFLSNFNAQFVYYYAISGFLYIWLIITCVGISIHWVLNLTEKSKKELFIATYMQNQMRKINMQQNMEKVLMISNMYELFNYKSEELLSYLKNQKHMMVAIRKQKQYQHDYELIDSEDKDPEVNNLNIMAKPINPLDMIKLFNFARTQQTEEEENDLQATKNPVLIHFREIQKNKIQIIKNTDVNNNQLEVKRMGAKIQQVPSNLREIQQTESFKAMQSASSELIAETMAKIFLFLSQPSKTIGRETFHLFLKIVMRETCSSGDSNTIYDRFGQNSLMDESKFKNFVLDYVSSNYQFNENSVVSKLRTFVCRIIVPLLLVRLEPLNYFLKRRKIQIPKQSLHIWLRDKNNDMVDRQFTRLRHKQLRKKANLLKITQLKNKTSNQQEQLDDAPQEEIEEDISRVSKKKVTANKLEKKQLKDKKLMKPENIYSILVNSLIECYLFYEKEAENFKIKSIKCSFSNILEILIKCNDIVFVFGYSTIYLFIAYYKQDYSQSSPFISYISYPVLLIVASFLVLAYIALIMYHKKDFETGSLGLDEDRKSLDFKSLKFYTKTVMFMLGSGLANYIIAIGLNSFICDSNSSTLYNFSTVDCHTKMHYGYMLMSLLVLVIYWPLSVITYPFNTAMQRGLQVKYKVEYEVLYLQVKFMINGFNTLLNPYSYQTEQLIGSILKGTLCSILAILYHRMQPCSYEFINMIEGKIYICLALLSFAGALCYFIGLLYSGIVTGFVLLLYLIYFIYVTFKNYNQLKNQNENDQIIEDNIKNQKNRKDIMRKTQQQSEQPSALALNRTELTASKIQIKRTNNQIEGRSLLGIFNLDANTQPSKIF